MDILFTGIARIVVENSSKLAKEEWERVIRDIVCTYKAVDLNSRAAVEWHFVDEALSSADWEASHSTGGEDG